MQRLKDYVEMCKELEIQGERMERLKTKMIGVGAQVITDMPKSPSPSNDRISDLMAQKIELEDEIGELYSEIQKERRVLKKAIRSLKSADQKAVIMGRYLDGEKFKDVNALVFGGRPDFYEREESYLRIVFNLQGAALVGLAKYFGMVVDNRDDSQEPDQPTTHPEEGKGT